MNETRTLRRLLEKAVRGNPSEGILFSGGLDTSIIAFLAARHRPKLFTVHIKDSGGRDIGYSKRLAKQLGLEHHVLELSAKELLKNIPQTIKILNSFDPMEIRNSVTIYSALTFAKKHADSVMTGDGADELFAGYSYMFEKNDKELRDYLTRLSKSMFFSSTELGKAVGIRVNIPYTHPEVKSFAIKLHPGFKVKEKNGKTYGKWILRRAFESDLPAELVWRTKTPIEFGSGSTMLTNLLESRLSDEEFETKRARYEATDNVKLRDKEQLYYYKIFRRIFGVPSPGDGDRCPHCNSEFNGELNFCRVCGAYPVRGDAG